MNFGPRSAVARSEPVLVAALGAVQTLAFVHTAWWPLPLLTLALLVWRLNQATPRRAALLGSCYGTAWVASGTWWLYISMHRYGELPAALAAAAVLALAAALSLYLAAACAVYARWRRGRGSDALLFGALWLLAELARGVVFTGFPWLALGYSQVDGPFAALAPWVGVYGIGAVAAVMAAGVVLPRGSRGRPGLLSAAGAVGAAVFGIVLLGSQLLNNFTRPAGEMSVALLQTNVAQDEKFSSQHMPETLAWVAQELMAARADLVVAPETAVPLLPAQLEELAPGYWPQLLAHFSWPERAALVGIPLGDLETGYTNSVMGLSAAPIYRYDKAHLVPFGEFIPRGFRWFTEMMNIPLGDFNRGTLNPPSFAVRTQRVAPNICYEDLFGEELARRFIDASAAPTVFANISNIGWFGDTVAIPQHLNISRMRALEFQRPMLRATNTGATAVIDHGGALIALLPPYTRGVLKARVLGRHGITPFAWWASRAGPSPLALAALSVVAVCVALSRRARSAPA